MGSDWVIIHTLSITLNLNIGIRIITVIAQRALSLSDSIYRNIIPI